VRAGASRASDACRALQAVYDRLRLCDPSTNSEIANELFLSVEAVKTHLRTLFRSFEISELPQNQNRGRSVACAFQRGLVSARDLQATLLGPLPRLAKGSDINT